MKVVTLDKEIFEKAFNLCHKVHTNDEIYDILCGNDDVEKQIAILQIKSLEDNILPEIIVQHLTGFDGPVREAAAIKIHEFFTIKNTKILDNFGFYQTYIDAVCDVNPNICRLIIDFLPKLNQQTDLYKLLIRKIENNFARIDNPDKEQKNFLTVRLFNLYWCLEAIGAILSKNFKENQLKKLTKYLNCAISYNDYTINEKVAKIVTYSDLTFQIFKEPAQILGNDTNFYVKRYFEQAEG